MSYCRIEHLLLMWTHLPLAAVGGRLCLLRHARRSRTLALQLGALLLCVLPSSIAFHASQSCDGVATEHALHWRAFDGAVVTTAAALAAAALSLQDARLRPVQAAAALGAAISTLPLPFQRGSNLRQTAELVVMVTAPAVVFAARARTSTRAVARLVTGW